MNAPEKEEKEEAYDPGNIRSLGQKGHQGGDLEGIPEDQSMHFGVPEYGYIPEDKPLKRSNTLTPGEVDALLQNLRTSDSGKEEDKKEDLAFSPERRGFPGKEATVAPYSPEGRGFPAKGATVAPYSPEGRGLGAQNTDAVDINRLGGDSQVAPLPDGGALEESAGARPFASAKQKLRNLR